MQDEQERFFAGFPIVRLAHTALTMGMQRGGRQEASSRTACSLQAFPPVIAVGIASDACHRLPVESA